MNIRPSLWLLKITLDHWTGIKHEKGDLIFVLSNCSDNAKPLFQIKTKAEKLREESKTERATKLRGVGVV